MRVFRWAGGVHGTLACSSQCLFLRHHKHRAGPPPPQKNVGEEACRKAKKQTQCECPHQMPHNITSSHYTVVLAFAFAPERGFSITPEVGYLSIEHRIDSLIGRIFSVARN